MALDSVRHSTQRMPPPWLRLGFVEKSHKTTCTQGACHYLTNRFQMEAPVAPSRSLREAFAKPSREFREAFAEPPRRLHEPFAEVYEPFAEVAHTEGSTKTPWRVHEASGTPFSSHDTNI